MQTPFYRSIINYSFTVLAPNTQRPHNVKFRHSFETRLLQAKYYLKQIQTLIVHTDIRTTEIYLHVLDEFGDTVKSPID